MSSFKTSHNINIQDPVSKRMYLRGDSSIATEKGFWFQNSTAENLFLNCSIGQFLKFSDLFTWYATVSNLSFIHFYFFPFHTIFCFVFFQYLQSHVPRLSIFKHKLNISSTQKHNFKHEISLKTLIGIPFSPNSKSLPRDKQHYWNQAYSFWGKIVIPAKCRDFGYRQWFIEASEWKLCGFSL
jgi:hypothetical protein